MIISSSGMMTGGRIVHHLRQRLPDARNTIVIGGYRPSAPAAGMIQDGAPFIRMFGLDVPVRAAVETVPGLSGHADRSDLLRWLGQLPHAAAAHVPHPRRTRRPPTPWPKNSAPPATGTSTAPPSARRSNS